MQNIFVYFLCNKMLKQKGKYKILKQCKIFWPFFFVEMLKKQGGIKIYKNEKTYLFLRNLAIMQNFTMKALYICSYFFFFYV
jgi:hypothetical protein